MTITREDRKVLDAAAAVRKRLAEPMRRLARDRQRAHKATTGQRQPRQHDGGFLAFLRRQPCVAGVVEGGCSGRVQAAHTRYSDSKHGRINPGKGRKPHDRDATPLCEGHHLHDQHTGSERAFWERLGIDPGELSPALYAAYMAGQDGAPIIHQFTQERSQ